MAHGFAHYSVGTMKEGSLKDTEISWLDMTILAAITYVGPLQGAKSLLRVGFDKHSEVVYAAALAQEVVLLWCFKYLLGCKDYALPYINITIILTMRLPQVLMVGWKEHAHIASRVDDHPLFHAQAAARFWISSMIVLEAFFCDTIRNMGGHLLFDMALFCGGLVDVIEHKALSRVKKVD
jgi:hypothetical protein